MKKCLLVSGGEYSPVENPEYYDFIIACDKGYDHCMKMGISPNIVIGDLDSCTCRIDERIRVIKLNPIKDDTDTISSVKFALDRGYKSIDICCAFGGRFDHSIANIQTAAFIMSQGGDTCITGKDTRIYSIHNEEVILPKEENCYLSVFSLSDVSRGVCIEGAKYELHDAEITNTYPIGTSNEWVKGDITVSVKEGMMIAVVSKNVKVD